MSRSLFIGEIRTTSVLNLRWAPRIHAGTCETNKAGFTTEDAEVRREVHTDSAFAFLCDPQRPLRLTQISSGLRTKPSQRLLRFITVTSSFQMESGSGVKSRYGHEGTAHFF